MNNNNACNLIYRLEQLNKVDIIRKSGSCVVKVSEQDHVYFSYLQFLTPFFTVYHETSDKQSLYNKRIFIKHIHVIG